MKTSVVVPFLNEEESLPVLCEKISSVLSAEPEEYEIILIDDGSTDSSCEVVHNLRKENPNIQLVSFSRNFGHQAALSAGLKYAKGDAVITMDADLQHPPELLPQLLEKWRSGAEVVQTLREKTEKEPKIKKIFSIGFYWIFKNICKLDLPAGAADFRLLDRKAVNALLQFSEPPFWRAMTMWVGFKREDIFFEAPERKFGTASYSFFKSFSMGIEGLFGFSKGPIIALWVLTLLSGLLGIIGVTDALIAFFRGVAVKGWSSIVIISGFSGCTILGSLAVIATYIERIHRIVLHRPLYLIRETTCNNPTIKTYS